MFASSFFPHPLSISVYITRLQSPSRSIEYAKPRYIELLMYALLALPLARSGLGDSCCMIASRKEDDDAGLGGPCVVAVELAM
jgi:hypothetical protein